MSEELAEQSGTFWEERGLYCCQQTELASGGSEGFGGSEEKREAGPPSH